MTNGYLKNSHFRNSYLMRLVFRIAVLLYMIWLFINRPREYGIVFGWNFFREFNSLTVIWLIWMFDMFMQLGKASRYWPLGSQKYRKSRFVKADYKPEWLIKPMQKSHKAVLQIAVVWILFVGIIGGIYLAGWIPYQIIVLTSGVFYVCDLICVLFWCPFRTFWMKNKCCTTCRIFNWDHAMMFLPLVVLPGFFGWSLVLTSWAILAEWEISYHKAPERFYEISNKALRCANCNDRLCGKKVVVHDLRNQKPSVIKP